jgi:hypothetical protein
MVKNIFLLLLIISSQCFANPYSAQNSDDNIVTESLSDSLPLAFDPFLLRVDDFVLEIENPEVRSLGVGISLQQNSVQWSRAGEYFVLPRATLKIEAPSDIKGMVRTSIMLTPLSQTTDGKMGAVVLVSLFESSLSDVELEFKKAGKLYKSILHIRPKPRTGQGNIVFDVSCSRRSLQILDNRIPAGQWVYIACRPLEIRVPEGRAQAQEFYILWSGKKSTVTVNGIAIESVNQDGLGLWEVMASPGSTVWDIEHGADGFRLQSFASPEVHRGSLAVATGPYATYFDGGGQNYNGVTALTSIYGSYLLSESSRMIYFAQVAAIPQLFSDYGFYIELESAKVVDRRLSFNLLLGVHGSAFFASGNSSGSNLSYNGHVDGPQGFELVYTDPHLPMQAISAGAFIQPSININSYYNIWLRWSRATYFVELNYLKWVQQIDQLYQSSSVGLSIGVPILRFF